MENNDKFSIFFHHGGKLKKIDGHLQYGGGQISSKHGLDPDRFGFLDLEEEVKNLGYSSWDSIQSLDYTVKEFKIIKDDKEVLGLLGGLKGKGKNRYISVYVDNGKVENSSCNVGKKAGKGICLDEGLYSDSSSDPCLKDALGSSFESSDNSDDASSFFNDDESQSDTDDEMSDEELAEGDEEYLEA